MRNIIKSIKNNPLYLFVFRILAIFFVVSFLWILAIFIYYENQIAYDLETEISKEKDSIVEFLDDVDLKSKDSNYYDSMKELEIILGKRNISYLQMYKNRNLLVEVETKKVPSFINKEINSFEILPKETKHTLLGDENEAFLYLQTNFTSNDKQYNLNLVFELDKKTRHLINNDVVFTLAVVFSTMFIVFLSIFPLIFKQYKGLLEKQKELELSNIYILQSLGNAISKRDSDTNEHNYRVTYYSIKIAEELGLSGDKIRALIKGAFLHDIGKIAISDNILLKPAKLDEAEFSIMKSHVNHGVDIVEDIPWLEDAKNVILYHHEKVNGTGYPKGLKGHAIPLEARIFAVADVFDALSSKRPYKEAMKIEKSMMIIKSDINKHFDEKVVNVFEKIYEDCHKNMNENNQFKENFKNALKPYFVNI